MVFGSAWKTGFVLGKGLWTRCPVRILAVEFPAGVSVISSPGC